mgnify:CR=1 FL=1
MLTLLGAAATAHAKGGVALRVLSNRADVISAGDALVEVMVRRTIADQPYNCGSNVSPGDEVAKVKKLCASLRAA